MHGESMGGGGEKICDGWEKQAGENGDNWLIKKLYRIMKHGLFSLLALFFFPSIRPLSIVHNINRHAMGATSQLSPPNVHSR